MLYVRVRVRLCGMCPGVCVRVFVCARAYSMHVFFCTFALCDCVCRFLSRA